MNALLLFLSLTVSIADQNSPRLSRVQDLIKLTVSQREAIYTLQLDVETKTVNEDKSTEDAVFKVWISPKKRRVDTIFDKDGVKTRTVRCADCDRSGYTTQYNSSGQAVSAVQYVKITEKNLESDIAWKMLGLSNSPLGGYVPTKYRRFIDTMASADPRLKSDIDFAEDASLLSLTRYYKDTVGSALLKFSLQHNNLTEISFNRGEGDDAISQKVTIDFTSDNSIFFPKQITIVTTSKGGIKTETISCKNVQINRAIPQEVFELKGFGIINGVPILAPGVTNVGTAPTWNNDSVDSTKTANDAFQELVLTGSLPAQADTPKPSLISQAWPYFLGFVIFAVIGFWLLRKQRQVAKEG